jgi:hypothetical protein
MNQAAFHNVRDFQIRRNGQRDHRDQLGCVAPDYGTSEYYSGGGVREDLDESGEVVVYVRFRDGRVRDLGDS